MTTTNQCYRFSYSRDVELSKVSPKSPEEAIPASFPRLTSAGAGYNSSSDAGRGDAKGRCRACPIGARFAWILAPVGGAVWYLFAFGTFSVEPSVHTTGPQDPWP